MLEAQQETIQDALNVKKTKVAIENNLIDCEAGIAFLEDMTILLENYITARKNSMGNHFGKVERRIDEISNLNLDNFKKCLRESVEVWGKRWVKRPFDEYVHEKSVYE